MDPAILEALIDAMASRRGADSESFFVAHGLGSAYSAPGANASKRAKINSAVQEALRSNPRVLDTCAAKFLGGDWTEQKSDVGGGAMSARDATGETVFVSHASADKDLAGALVNLLRLGVDLRGTEITFTSHPGTGMPTGVPNYMDWLRLRLDRCRVFVALLSPSYLESTTCLLEFGAAWVKQVKVVPLLVPPLDYGQGERTFGKISFGRINSSESRADLRDEVQKAFPTGAPTAAWDREDRLFADKLQDLLAQVALSERVDRSELVQLQGALEVARQEINDLERGRSRLQSELAEVSALKNQQEVLETRLEHSDEPEQFEALRKAAADALGALRPHTRYAIYETEGKGDELYRPPQWEEDVEEAVRAGELKFDEDRGGYSPNLQDPSVEEALFAVQDLFWREWSKEFAESFKREHRKALSIEVEPVWKELGLL